MLDRLHLVWLAAGATSYLTPQRLWTERLAFFIPAPSFNRSLLLADAVCLVVIALGWRRPMLAIPGLFAVGFLALNVAGMALTDFYLGLVLFHVVVAVAALGLARRARWVGAAALTLTLALGALT